MGGVSIWHWVVVGIVVMLLFGRGKISELMGDMAKGIKEFKKGMADEPTGASTPASPPEATRTLDHRPETAAAGVVTPTSPTLADRKLG